MPGESTQAPPDKIIKLTDLPQTVAQLAGKSIVLAGGCFDIFHFGHLTFLMEAKKQGDILMVLLEPDQFIHERKQKTPTHTQEQRALVLASLIQVDYVILVPRHLKTFEEYLEIVKTIKPRVIAVSEGDNHLDLKKKQAFEVGAAIKEVTSHIKKFSSTNIRHIYETFPGN